ncbi:MAG: molybdopterin-guanine dinucleotide biosynthesis protein MobB, partial [bacterium]
MKGGPVALAFVARRSGTGKTTLMESVTRHLRERGWEVGAVKHSGHHVQLDREGTDSWRLSQAGSTVTVIAAPGLLAT